MRTLFALTLLLPTISFAQLDIKLNILSTSNLKPELGLEMGYDKFSIELDNGLILQKWADATLIDEEGNKIEIGTKRFGYNGTLRSNFYFSPRESLDGWYVSPLLKYRSQKIMFEDPIRNKRAGAALVLGTKGMVFDQLGFSVEGGFGYWIVNNYKNSAGESSPIYRDAFIFQNLLEKLDKFIIPISATVFYRIGG